MSTNSDKPQPPPVYKVKRTFHQRILPTSTCTSFSSPGGKALFQSASRHHGLKSFFCLIEQFLTQSDPAFCGITTLVMVLNALSVDPRIIWKGGWRWYEDSMLNCCVDMESVKTIGISLPKFICLANCQGLHTEQFLAEESSVEHFRAIVKDVCIDQEELKNLSPMLPVNEEGCESKPVSDSLSGFCKGVHPKDSQKILVVTYNRASLGQTGTGHFSPIAAYDPMSDKVLILDVARFKYGPHWVSVPLLFDAMQPCDPATDRSRGFVLLSFQETPDCCQRVLPQSKLFRSEMSNYAPRQKYRKFLSERGKSATGAKGSSEITLEEVHKFVTEDGTKCESVLDMISPQLIPLDLVDKRNVDNLMYLIQSLTSGHIEKYESECCENECTLGKIPKRKAAQRMIHIRPIDIIYVIFLASLSPKQCEESVRQSMEDKNIDDVSDDVVEQLLSEATLVRLAIEYSNVNMDGPEQVNKDNSKDCSISS